MFWSTKTTILHGDMWIDLKEVKRATILRLNNHMHFNFCQNICLHVPVYVCLFASCVFACACCTKNNDNNNHIILAWHSVVVFFLKSSVDVRGVLEWEIFCYLLSFTFEYPNRIFRACRNNVLKLFHQRLSCRLLLKTKVSPSLSLFIST